MEKIIDNTLISKLQKQASSSDRKRSHFNLHSDSDEPVQRLCIALRRGTYVRPHCHPQSHKWEMMLALMGEVLFLSFDGEGRVIKRLILSPMGDSLGIEITPGTWHTVIPLTEEACIMEVKEGPYLPSEAAQFAEWAPEEGSNVESFLSWLESAKVGERYIRNQ